jgi:AcrR family transcriptional regulator
LRELASKNRPGTAVSEKGNQRIDQIIRAARDTLIRGGYHGFTMRAVAAECEISVGNLNYYYASKADLLADLLEIVIGGYLADFDNILSASDPRTPEQALEGVIHFIIADIGTRETTVFFPELWALANHDANASKRMHELYAKARLVFDDLIPKINAALSKSEVRQVSLFLSASLEGHTMFVGYKKPWAKDRQCLSNIAAKGLLDLVRSISPADIANLKTA